MAEPGAGEGASIARFSARQPVLVNLIALAMVVTGGYLLSGMTREVYPSVPVGGASIVTVVPGASAEEVEQLVTAPLEDELSDIEDVDVISSTSSDGLSFIWVEMDASVEDTGRKVLEITNEVNRVTNLPAGAQAPVVREAAVRIPTIAVTVGGDAPEAVLRAVAREMEERLGRIDGVGQVTTTGIRDRELHVDVDPDRLEAYGVPLAAVAGALSGRGSNIPAGHMDSGRHSRMVRGMARTVTAAQVERVVVRPSPQGGSLTVGDLARVEAGYERALTVARVDGEPGIVFILLKDDRADALRISEDARAVVRAMQAEAPPGVRIGVFGDTAFWVRANLDTLYANAAMGLGLVLAILWLFVGFRNGMMAALGIPVAIAGGVVVMHLLGITINLISLMALILSLGIIVDDAIIIIENVHRHVEEGTPRVRAAIVGTMEVFWPVVSSTATTCSAFLPLLLMTGVLGEFFAIIPKVIAAALIASLIEAFLILPSHLAEMGGEATKSERGWLARKVERVEELYARVLRVALRWRLTVVLVTYAICIGLITTAAMVKSVTLFTEGDVEAFDVRVRMPTDAAPEETDRVLAEIERRILALEERDVEAVISSRGYSRTRTWNVTGDHVGMVNVYMRRRDQRARQDAGTRLMERVAHLFDDLVGPASVEVVKFEDGPPRGAPVAVRISGDDLEQLADLSERVQAELRAVRGVRDVSDDHELGKQELRVHVDEERAALHGLTSDAIHRWLALAFGASPVATAREGGEEVDLVVRLREDARQNPERLAELTLVTPAGASVALGEVATIERGRGISSIRRRDRRRVITVTAELVEGSGVQSADANAALAARIAPLIAASSNVRFELGGEFEETQESLDSLFLAFLVAALLIYTILATQFRSFLQPLVVMTAIPLSLIGVSIGFLASGEAVGLIGLIGVVGLAGIVVNDSLVLVDFINTRRARGAPLDEAIVEAGRLRLRPIFLTSITTIAGLGPLALGIGGRSELLAPMATAIAWGLTFSTVLILVIVPCLYRSVDSMAQGARRLLGPLLRLAAGTRAGPEGDPSAAE
ncbi:MAG: efflux RND transporter permease subunit [Sandaracinaceae bacterium]|nr:efflux RND transporter permease subunit [Sandaracinaceae bacterium]